MNSKEALAVKEARKYLGLTQAELAAQLQISGRRLQAYENFEREIPSYLPFALEFLCRKKMMERIGQETATYQTLLGLLYA